MERATLSIDGMSCGHCVKGVSSALQSLPGVTVEDVKVGEARVSYDPARVTPEALADAVTGAGYEAKVAGAGSAAAACAPTEKSGGACGCC